MSVVRVDAERSISVRMRWRRLGCGTWFRRWGIALQIGYWYALRHVMANASKEVQNGWVGVGKLDGVGWRSGPLA
jgi:hypothetical protein